HRGVSLWSFIYFCLRIQFGIFLFSPSNFPSLLSHSSEYKVSISGTDVVLTCPPMVQGQIHWEKNGHKISDENEEQLFLKNFSEMENSGYYACYADAQDKRNHYLYLRARVCENCIEVDLTAVVTIVIVDILFTLGLLMVVFCWSKNRKARSKPVTRGAGAGGRPRGQKKERPPPVPNPDYEVIGIE
uniref:T-cell surface glycoprotein CD3 epsilon chain n=1 Tax=Sciurus vulgaris TaxID=55149 RepID=A0A8D2DX58_SCIVU